MKYKKIIFFFVFCASLLNNGNVVCAQSATANDAIRQLQVSANKAELGDPVDIRSSAARIIKLAFGFVGIIFVVLFFLAGYWYLNSHGEEEKITAARKTMQGAIIGMLVSFLAFSIAYFVGSKTQEAVNMGTPNIPSNNEVVPRIPPLD